MRRLLTIAVLVFGMIGVAAGPAFAHFCENVSRPAKASAKVADKSKAWIKLGDELPHVFHEISEEAASLAGIEDDDDFEEFLSEHVRPAEHQLLRDLRDAGGLPEEGHGELISSMVEAAKLHTELAGLVDAVILTRATAAGGVLRKADMETGTFPKQSTDGKGIDHRVELFGAFEILIGIYLDHMS
jgi:hypothetical protein